MTLLWPLPGIQLRLAPKNTSVHLDLIKQSNLCLYLSKLQGGHLFSQQAGIAYMLVSVNVKLSQQFWSDLPGWRFETLSLVNVWKHAFLRSVEEGTMTDWSLHWKFTSPNGSSVMSRGGRCQQGWRGLIYIFLLFLFLCRYLLDHHFLKMLIVWNLLVVFLLILLFWSRILLASPFPKLIFHPVQPFIFFFTKSGASWDRSWFCLYLWNIL